MTNKANPTALYVLIYLTSACVSAGYAAIFNLERSPTEIAIHAQILSVSLATSFVLLMHYLIIRKPYEKNLYKAFQFKAKHLNLEAQPHLLILSSLLFANTLVWANNLLVEKPSWFIWLALVPFFIALQYKLPRLQKILFSLAALLCTPTVINFFSDSSLDASFIPPALASLLIVAAQTNAVLNVVDLNKNFYIFLSSIEQTIQIPLYQLNIEVLKGNTDFYRINCESEMIQRSLNIISNMEDIPDVILCDNTPLGSTVIIILKQRGGELPEHIKIENFYTDREDGPVSVHVCRQDVLHHTFLRANRALRTPSTFEECLRIDREIAEEIRDLERMAEGGSDLFPHIYGRLIEHERAKLRILTDLSDNIRSVTAPGYNVRAMISFIEGHSHASTHDQREDTERLRALLLRLHSVRNEIAASFSMMLADSRDRRQNNPLSVSRRIDEMRMASGNLDPDDSPASTSSGHPAGRPNRKLSL